MKTVCPRCRAEYAISPEHVGTSMTCAKCNTPFSIAAAPELPPSGPAPGGPPPGWGQPGGYQGWAQPAAPGSLALALARIRAARLTWLLIFAAALVFIFVLGGIMVSIDVLSTQFPGVGGLKKFEALLFTLGGAGTIVFFIVSAIHRNVCLTRIADSEERRR
ncbi:MAG: zinc-ribbon domain-containing protein [Deltaproteobacteria bacterium]|jgi:hypothetical protein|nr:zinc-ribbon domain-containing protein [Deltaproteobacteria bacterium]